MKKTWAVLLSVLTLNAYAGLSVPMFKTALNNDGVSIGTIQLDDTLYGLMITPSLHHLAPGVHGIYIHALPNCNNYGRAAGAHFDPVRTDSHRGPYRGDGHLGDLPVLVVDNQGNALLPILAPRLKLADIKGLSIMIHAGSDNYSDIPVKLGGSGDPIGCGLIPYH